MKPKDTKRAIDQLIGDIQHNEWYCVQGGSESELKDWEKELIVTGLRKLLLDADFEGETIGSTTEMLKKERTNSFVDIRDEALSDSEKEGIEKLFDMMLSLRQQIQLRDSFEKEMSRNEMPNGAKLCPFCAGEATMRPEGDYWEITCDDCGVSKQGSTFDEAWNEWNLRRL
jgi:ribosomal protein L37AE/L43A